MIFELASRTTVLQVQAKAGTYTTAKAYKYQDLVESSQTNQLEVIQESQLR